MTATPPPSGSHEIITPEGVPLRFTVARSGDRAGAFLIDCIILLAGVAVVLAGTIFGFSVASGVALAAGILAFFLLRNFYFTWFECRWQGSTPGKRALGLRVIDRNGGPLTAEAVFARNVTREIEFFVPLAVLLNPGLLFPDAPLGTRILSSVWLFVVASLPLFNRDHLRLGDLVAGTLVVLNPRFILLDDLAAPREGAVEQPRFTPEQLDVYGIHELHVLEGLLRDSGGARANWPAVAETIQQKIGWRVEGRRPDSAVFLKAFYSAQRAHLEHKMLLGERRERKRSERPIRRP